MEVHFSPDLQSKLIRLATEQGLDSEELVREAVERLVNYDEWFRTEVQTGLSQIEQGKTASHEDVGKRLDAYLANKQQPV
jgi:predicted transcriptional regulator